MLKVVPLVLHKCAYEISWKTRENICQLLTRCTTIPLGICMIYQWIISCLSGSKWLILQGLRQTQGVFLNKPLSLIQKYCPDIFWPHRVFRNNNIFAYQTYVLSSYRWNQWLQYMFMIITRFVSYEYVPFLPWKK